MGSEMCIRDRVFGNLFRAKVLGLRKDAEVKIEAGQVSEQPAGEEENKAE